MAQRRPPTQYQQIEAQKPYMGEYSALAEQFLRKKDKPIYSVGQGLVEAGSDIAEAYMMRKAMEREKKKEDKDISDVAMAQRFAMDQGLARDPNSGALYSAEDFGGLQTQGIDPMSAQQRAAAATNRLAEVNPRAAVATAPGIMDIAKQFEPKPPVERFIDEQLPGGARGQRNSVTNQLTVPFTPPAQRESEPLVEVADPNDPTRGIMVPRSQAAGRGTVQTVRDRMPRVKTYYDEEGNPLTLDANDPVDQATIKERSLVESAPSESERTSKGFLDRMLAAEPNMQSVVDAGYDPSNLRDKMLQGGVLGNYAISENGQLYRQAQEDWVRAKLRKESGAVIGDDEMEREIKTYFPQPGNPPSVQAQKAASRKAAERQLATTAGLLGRKYLRGDNEKKVEAPTAAQDGVPEGIDANVWQYMTPQERALWSK